MLGPRRPPAGAVSPDGLLYAQPLLPDSRDGRGGKVVLRLCDERRPPPRHPVAGLKLLGQRTQIAPSGHGAHHRALDLRQVLAGDALDE